MRTIENTYLITGRKSYESAQGEEVFGPYRQFVIITRQKNYKPKYGKVAHSLEEALKIALKDGAKTCCILGGATIYKQAMTIADKLIITEVHEQFEGDTYFPEINEKIWKETKRQDFPKDAENPYSYSFVVFERLM